MNPLLIMIGLVVVAAAVATLLAFVVFRDRPKREQPEEPDPWETLSLGPAPTNVSQRSTRGGRPSEESDSPSTATSSMDPHSPPTSSIVPQSDELLFAGQSYRVKLAYQDYMGGGTEREVDVRTAWRESQHLYLHGWCHLRNGWRTFRADRVLTAEADGMAQPADGPTLIEHLRRLSPPPAPDARRPNSSPTSSRIEREISISVGSVDVRASDVDQLTAMVFVLVYVARADGRFAAREKEAVLPLLTTWAGGMEGVPHGLVDLGKVYVEREEFQHALDALAYASDEVKLGTITGAVQVAQASAGVKEDEAVVLLELEKRLFPPDAEPSQPSA